MKTGIGLVGQKLVDLSNSTSLFCTNAELHASQGHGAIVSTWVQLILHFPSYDSAANQRNYKRFMESRQLVELLVNPINALMRSGTCN